jgi:DNA-binding NarL/FixJ family response regulator
MPIMDGVALTYYIKICFQDIIVIGLSVYSDENSLLDILLSGADGYVIKAQAENFLLEAIQAVMRNEVYIDNRIDTNKQLIKSMFLNHSNDKYTNIFGITQREKIFLTLNATTFSYKEIAELMFIEIKTVQTYYDRIAKKMNTNSRLGLTLCSLQYGYARIANFKQYNTTDT